MGLTLYACHDEALVLPLYYRVWQIGFSHAAAHSMPMDCRVLLVIVTMAHGSVCRGTTVTKLAVVTGLIME